MGNINITDKAISKIQEVLASQGMKYFRIKVKGGGCSGFLYDIKIEPEPRSDDLIIEFDEDNLKVCLDPQSNFMLSETTVDPTTSVPILLLTFLSWNCCLCSILAFLTETIFS